jgi:alpha,alpha-trehalose-phosphate synthase [UDP-forming]
MRQVLLITGGAVLAVSVIFGIFAINQVRDQKIELTSRLESRSQVLAESLAESVEPPFVAGAIKTVQRIVDRFVSNERLAGLGVFENTGAPVATSVELPLPADSSFITDTMDRNEPHGDYVYRGGVTYYVYALPLHDGDRVLGALVVVQNATYIDDNIGAIWKDNAIRLLSQILLIAIAIFVLVRWVFFRSVSKLTEFLQAVRRGEVDIDQIDNVSFLKPLSGEISKVTKSLRQARIAASEEARMRFEKLDSPWTAERLKEFIKAYRKDRPMYVLSNREPYVHSKVKNKIEWSVPAGGVITALEPVMDACGGTWIAHGSGNADQETVDKNDKIKVPPDEPKYSLKRVWLSEKEVKGYYTGFSNEALWPLCLMAHTRPIFRTEDWMEYKSVNAKFAKILLDEIRHEERPIVLVQDYHLALVPEMIKKSRPDALVALFWHIPWPSAAQFNICPWRKEILRGMLGADLVGFHTQQYCNNFIDTVANEIESRIDHEMFSVFCAGHQTSIKPFPISIAFPGNGETHPTDKSVLQALGVRGAHLMLGVDRLDYTKGILERFKGVEFLLDRFPQYRGAATLLQIAAPTRESVEKYREYAELVTAEAERVNEKFATKSWKPIVLEKRHYSHDELSNLYRLADVCLITSLHDGMNLVAKEYAAARDDEEGVLVLSQFAGASRDLKSALLINPYSAEETSSALHVALTMPKSEQRRRMKAMRTAIRNYNIYRWSAELIKSLSQLE